MEYSKAFFEALTVSVAFGAGMWIGYSARGNQIDSETSERFIEYLRRMAKNYVKDETILKQERELQSRTLEDLASKIEKNPQNLDED